MLHRHSLRRRYGKDPEVEGIAIGACYRFSRAVKPELWVDVMAGCIDIAGGDREKLTWKTAAADLRTYDAEVARIAAEKAATEAEDDREKQRRAEEREREQRASGGGHVDPAARLERCARCKVDSQCTSPDLCVWTGEHEFPGGPQIRFCGSASWGQVGSKKHCMGS